MAIGNENARTLRLLGQLALVTGLLAHNPEVSDDERETWAEPDWNDWVHLSLVMPLDDGSENGAELNIELLRPDSWVLSQMSYIVDEKQPTTLSNLGPVAPRAESAFSQAPNTPIASNLHPPFAKAEQSEGHEQVLDVGFEGEAKSIRVTDNHLFWSVDRQQFLPIGKMEIGEQVQTFHGDTKRVAAKLPRPGPQVVYNLEVYGEHVYFVGEQGLLAHNTYSVKSNRIRSAHLRSKYSNLSEKGRSARIMELRYAAAERRAGRQFAVEEISEGYLYRGVSSNRDHIPGHFLVMPNMELPNPAEHWMIQLRITLTERPRPLVN